MKFEKNNIRWIIIIIKDDYYYELYQPEWFEIVQFQWFGLMNVSFPSFLFFTIFVQIAVIAADSGPLLNDNNDDDDDDGGSKFCEFSHHLSKMGG